MKTFLGLVGVFLASVLFCPAAMAVPPMPSDVNMVEPDPSLPKELRDFWGKWEGQDKVQSFFLIIEKIDDEKATFYQWRSGTAKIPPGWNRFQVKVTKENGGYKLSHRSGPQYGTALMEYRLKGKYLDVSHPYFTGYRYTRVP